MTNSTRTLSVKDAKDENAVLGVAAVATLIPALNESAIISAITGKPLSVAHAYLTALSGVSSVETSLNLPLPGFLRHLPFATKNISLVIVPE